MCSGKKNNGISGLCSRLIKNRFFCTVFPILLCLAGYVVFTEIIPQMKLLSHETYLCTSQKKGINLTADRTIVQEFEMPYDRISELKVAFKKYHGNSVGKIRIELLDEKQETLYSWVEREDLLEEIGYLSLELDSMIPVVREAKYSLKITAESNDDSYVKVLASSKDKYEKGTLTVNGKTRSQDLAFSVSGMTYGAEQKYIFAIIYCIVAVLFVICFRRIVLTPSSLYMQSVDRLDWVLVAVAAVACALLFSQYSDIELTIKHSEDLISIIKSGQFLQYYDLVLEKAMEGGYGRLTYLDAANYNIVLYLVLSVIISPWVLADKLLGLGYDYHCIVIYFQIIVVLLDFAAAWLLMKVCMEFGCDRHHAKLTSYLFLSSSMTLFATAGFAQLDIVYMIVLLASLLYYARGQYYRFSLVISVAIMLKAFPVLIFIPLILLTNKKLWQILINVVLGASSSLIFILLFGSNYGYTATKAKMDGSYNFVNRILSSGMMSGISFISLFLVIFVVLCIWVYGIKAEDRSKRYVYMIYCGLVVYGSFAVLILWHPQWLVILSLFVAMLIPVYSNTKQMLYCDLALQICYLAVSNVYFYQTVDNYMINNGILPLITGHKYAGTDIRSIAQRLDYVYIACFSALTGNVIAMAYLFLRSLGKTEKTEKTEKTGKAYPCERIVIWIRLSVIYVYILMLCVFFFFIG